MPQSNNTIQLAASSTDKRTRRRRFTVIQMLGLAFVVLTWPGSARSQTARRANPVAAAEDHEKTLWKAAENLGDDRFQVRQAAMETLWRAGEAARPMLLKAAGHSDREVSSRAEAVLTRFRFGLYADIDPTIERWINAFRFGDIAEKRSVIEGLRELGDITRLVNLIRAEPSEKIRQSLVRAVAASIDKYAAQLPHVGAEDQWDQLLSLSVSNEQGMRHYAAFLALSGRAEDKIAELENKLLTDKSPATAELLVWVHRAQGDLAAAARVAASKGLTPLQRELAFEARDWPQLERLLEQTIEKARDPNDLESLGVLAAAQRLQGKHEDFEQSMARIAEIGASNSGYAFYAAEALMINGNPEAGIALAASLRPDHGFRLLVRQGKFRQAFDLVGMGDSQAEREAWFQMKLKESMVSASSRDAAFELLTYSLRAQHAVGFREEAIARVKAAAERMMQDKSRRTRLATLSETALLAGRRQLAKELAADSIVGGRASNALSNLFPNHTDDALLAWRFLEVDASGESKLARLDRLETLIQPKTEMSLAEARDFTKRWLEAQRQGTTAEETAWLRTLASILKIHGHSDEAVKALEPIVDKNVDAAMQAAEWRLAEENYADAEKHFSTALRLKRNDPSALYLRGWARKKLGRDEEGDADIAGAKLAPLSASIERRKLAQTLKRNGLTEEALAEYRFLLRTGMFQEWYVNDAAKQIGNTISGEDRRSASELWERLLFSGFKRDRWFTDIEGYLQLTHLVHKTRGRALLAEGKSFAGFQELLFAQAMMPEDITLAEDVVPELEAKGEQAKADILFELVRRANAEIVRDFPRSAMHMNNIAWVSARCDRDLEAALKLSRQANEIRPDNASYIDTLGEVLFRLGQKDEAVKCAKRCIELAPGNSFYREQLERFQKETP